MNRRNGHAELTSKRGLKSVLVLGLLESRANLSYLFDGQFGDPATLDVDGSRHRLNVVGIDAAAIAAEMVKLHAFGNGAVNPLVDNAMRWPLSPLRAIPSQAIPGSGSRSPLPTGRRISAIYNRVLGSRASGARLMPEDEPFRLPSNPAVLASRDRGDWRGLTAAALAQARRIRANFGIMGAQFIDLLDRSVESRALGA